MKRCHLLVLSLLAFTIVLYLPTQSYSQNLPSYKVLWHKHTAVNVLVPKNTTDEELKNLVLAFQKARQTKTFANMGIPKTSMPIDPPQDPNANIFLMIFSEPRWASLSEAKKYENIPSQKESQTYLNHVRASYVYSNVRSLFGDRSRREWEVGALGYSESNDLKSKHYKEFFHTATKTH